MGTLVPDTMSSPPQPGRLGLAVGCITRPTKDNRRQKIQNLYSLRGWSRRRDPPYELPPHVHTHTFRLSGHQPVKIYTESNPEGVVSCKRKGNEPTQMDVSRSSEKSGIRMDRCEMNRNVQWQGLRRRLFRLRLIAYSPKFDLLVRSESPHFT